MAAAVARVAQDEARAVGTQRYAGAAGAVGVHLDGLLDAVFVFSFGLWYILLELCLLACLFLRQTGMVERGANILGGFLYAVDEGIGDSRTLFPITAWFEVIIILSVMIALSVLRSGSRASEFQLCKRAFVLETSRAPVASKETTDCFLSVCLSGSS